MLIVVAGSAQLRASLLSGLQGALVDTEGLHEVETLAGARAVVGGLGDPECLVLVRASEVLDVDSALQTRSQRPTPAPQALRDAAWDFESELLRRERELQRLADDSPDVIARFDRDLRHVFANAAATQATGLSREQLLGKSNRELGMPEHLCAFWEDALRSVFATGERRVLDFSSESSGEERHYVSRLLPVRNDDGEVEHVLCIAEEVTERVRAERATRANEERLRSVVAAARMVWWDYDVHRDHIVWSPDAALGLALDSQPAPGGIASMLGLVHPSDRARAQATIDDALTQRGSFSCELRWVLPDGSERWHLSTGKVSCDALGKPQRIVGVELDISEQKQREQRLREADQQKDQFIATLAHELRNPLAPLRTGLELLEISHGNLQTSSRARRMMERQLTQLIRLVDDLLDVSRIANDKVQLRRTRLDLRAVIESAIETTRPLIDAAQQSLSYDRPGSPVVVQGDAQRLTQVVANLLHNATKYSARQGNITVTLRAEDNQAVVRVVDDGIGIAVEQQRAVFELFAQVTRTLGRSQGGLGVGLALVRRLVEAHGGSVELYSDGEGSGSTFTVRLPLEDGLAEAATPEADDAPAPIAGGTPLRVLIVDDNEDACALLAAVLQAWGHDVVTAYHGEDAVALAVQCPPDLVLCDIGLPDIDGYEVCRRLRRAPSLQHTVIAALTGWAAETDRQRSREAGFDLHLAKPVDHAALQRVLTSAVVGA